MSRWYPVQVTRHGALYCNERVYGMPESRPGTPVPYGDLLELEQFPPAVSMRRAIMTLECYHSIRVAENKREGT
jgi:hypothetical protein